MLPVALVALAAPLVFVAPLEFVASLVFAAPVLGVFDGFPQPLPPATGVQLYVALGSKSVMGGDVVSSLSVA